MSRDPPPFPPRALALVLLLLLPSPTIARSREEPTGSAIAGTTNPPPTTLDDSSAGDRKAERLRWIESLAAKVASTVHTAANDAQNANINNSKSRLDAIEAWLEKLNEGYTVLDSEGNEVPFEPVAENRLNFQMAPVSRLLNQRCFCCVAGGRCLVNSTHVHQLHQRRWPLHPRHAGGFRSCLELVDGVRGFTRFQIARHLCGMREVDEKGF